MTQQNAPLTIKPQRITVTLEPTGQDAPTWKAILGYESGSCIGFGMEPHEAVYAALWQMSLGVTL